jgi:cell division protein FtsB
MPEEANMEKVKEILSRIRFVYRRTSNVTKIVVAVTIVLCMATLITLRLSMTAMQERTEDMRQKAGQLESANQELEQKIAELGSDKSTVEIAEEELGLVQPGAVIIETEP